MSNRNPKPANTPAISRLRLASLLLLALLVIVPVQAGLPQSNLADKGSILGGQGAVSAQRQTLAYATDSPGMGYDSGMMQKRMKMLNNERRKSLISDSDKLFKLATELNNEIARSNPGTLTPEQLRKVAEIEKLAHNVRDKMTQIVDPNSTDVFPFTSSN